MDDTSLSSKNRPVSSAVEEEMIFLSKRRYKASCLPYHLPACFAAASVGLLSIDLVPAFSNDTMTVIEDSVPVKPSGQHVEPRPESESQVMKCLSHTPYKCLSVKQLSGGMANFTYRGILHSQLSNKDTRVIIKHGQRYDTAGSPFLPAARCAAETAALRLMHGNSFKHANLSIRTPHHLYLDIQTRTQVIEDIPSCELLRDYLHSNAAQDMPSSRAKTIGQGLGRWLSELHARDWSWIDDELKATFDENDAALRDSAKLAFDLVMSLVGNDPPVREGILKVFSPNNPSSRCMIHGDFTTRNLLIQSSPRGEKGDHIVLAVVDWELSRFGCITQDLGDMITCLYIHWQFEDAPSAEIILREFIRGYIHGHGPLDEALVFRIVGLMGIYLLFWGHLGLIDGEETETRTRDIHARSKEFFIKGAQKDREWLSNSFLRELLDNGS